MSIVCMVVPQQLTAHHNISNETENSASLMQSNDSSLAQCGNSMDTEPDFGYEGEFFWSRQQVGYILAGYFYGYLPMQIISGMLADRFGVRHVLGTGTLIGGILSLLTPTAARLHVGLLIALRVLIGVSMGGTFTCIQSCVGNWVPQSERSGFMGLVYGGIGAGLITSYLLTGFLCRYSWTLVFYILGAAVVLWYIVYLFIVYNTPDDHPRITDDEKMYIKSGSLSSSRGRSKIPYKDMLTSRAVLALSISQFSTVWHMYTRYTAIPLFMQDILYVDIKSNGFLSSIPGTMQLLFAVAIGRLCDVVYRKCIPRSRRTVRCLAQSIFSFGAGGAMVAVSYMQCQNRILAVVLLCVMEIAVCFVRPGCFSSSSDMAPRYAGSLYGIVNFIASLAGFLSPISIGNLTPTGSATEWRIIFALDAGILFIGWLAFVLFVPAEEQEWAKPKNMTGQDYYAAEVTTHGTEPSVEFVSTKDQNLDKDDNDV